jgi:hypothetical protein
MTQSITITADRVSAILEAYGADPARWPASERAACAAWLAAYPTQAAAWLAEARTMDRLLGTVTLADQAHIAADQRLQDTIIQNLALPGAVVLPFRARATKTPVKRAMPLIWATGVGLAACLAGAAVGANLSLASMGDVRAQSVLEQVQLADTESDT